MLKEKIKNVFKSPLTYILLVSVIIHNILYRFFDSFSEYNDTASYIDLYKENIFKGELNNSRTPIYPYFCKLIKLFGEENLYNHIVFAQKILFLLSIVFFYFTLKKLFKSKITYTIITLLYSLCPFIFLWNTVLLTESLTIFEFILLLYFTISYIVEPKKWNAFFIGVVIFLLVMTRPANLFLLGLYVIFWILKFIINKEERKYIKFGFISIIITIFITLLYCCRMNSLYGLFNLTGVSDINNVMLISKDDLYKYGDNEEIVEIYDNVVESEGNVEHWVIVDEVFTKFDKRDIHKFVKSVKRKSGIKYYFYIIKKFFGLSPDSVGIIYSTSEKISTVENFKHLSYTMLPISFGLSYMIFAISLGFIIYYLFKFRKIDWVVGALFTLGAGNMFVAIAFAPFESERLSLNSLIVLIILISYLVKRIFIDKEKIKKNMKKKNGIAELIDYMLSFNIKKLFKEKTDNTFIQFFRYLFVGGIAAVVNIGMLYVFTDIINLYYIISNILSFILGLIVNYVLSKKFVFQEETTISKSKEFLIYAIIGVIGLGIDTLLVWLFTDIIGLYYMISKLISTMIVFIWNFGARKVLYKIIK